MYEVAKVLICGHGRNKKYLGNITSADMEEGIMDAVAKIGKVGADVEIINVSNGTLESLENGDITANDI